MNPGIPRTDTERALDLLIRLIHRGWEKQVRDIHIFPGQPVKMRVGRIVVGPDYLRDEHSHYDLAMDADEIMRIAAILGWPNRSSRSIDFNGKWRAKFTFVPYSYGGRYESDDVLDLNSDGGQPSIQRLLATSLPPLRDGDRTSVEPVIPPPSPRTVKGNAADIVSHGGMGIMVEILQHTPVSFEQIGFPSEIPSSVARDGGLVIVAGPNATERATTMASLVIQLGRLRATANSGVSIATAEHPIEYVFIAESIATSAVIAQAEIGKDFQLWDEALAATAKRDADIVLISNLTPIENGRYHNNVDAALIMVSSGQTVIGGTAALSFTEAFLNCTRRGTIDETRRVQVCVASSLRAITLQQTVAVPNLKSKFILKSICSSVYFDEERRRKLVDMCEKDMASADKLRFFFKGMHQLRTPGNLALSDAKDSLPANLRGSVLLSE